ncbi:hypothetical protein [Amycolatopsis anabasis]|uniref:hypothetical protein n=1 Tax=Amycolatopsis anabasis TaxID=1840409 RepID=UPI00131B4628|nr:hypothetical protein [Amycolatopsis anabasis]
MLSTQPELVWQGRIHLGDEPGVYGDADYPGIALELPLTLRKTDPAGPDSTTLVLRTQDVQTFTGYPGHLITVTAYVPDPADPFHADEQVLATARLTSADNNRKEIPLDLGGLTSPIFVSVRVRVDTEVPPGLYDDFVVTKLSNQSANFVFVASFGFSA